MSAYGLHDRQSAITQTNLTGRSRRTGLIKMKMDLKQIFEDILISFRDACLHVYKERIVSLCVFGSVAAQTMRPDSDIDVLVVCNGLPNGRIARIREFEAVDVLCQESLEQAKRQGVYTDFSPIIKTPDEVYLGSPVFLDMTDTARILVDREDFLKIFLNRFRNRLSELGAMRVEFGGGYYWILKPNLKPGEEIIL